MATIAEVAARAGVGAGTVSRVLNGSPKVSETTRAKVQSAIAELGYRPNAAARALKEGRTRTLGLVIPPASQRLTDMQLGFVAGVVEAAARADLDALTAAFLEARYSRHPVGEEEVGLARRALQRLLALIRRPREDRGPRTED